MKPYKPIKRQAKDGTCRGRPRTTIDDGIVRILEDEFKIDSNVVDACHRAKITRERYYDELKANPEFAYRIRTAQLYVDRLMRATVVHAVVVKRDWRAALGWLKLRNWRYMPSQRQEDHPKIIVKFGSAFPEVHPFLSPDDDSTPSTSMLRL